MEPPGQQKESRRVGGTALSDMLKHYLAFILYTTLRSADVGLFRNNSTSFINYLS